MTEDFASMLKFALQWIGVLVFSFFIGCLPIILESADRSQNWIETDGTVVDMDVVQEKRVSVVSTGLTTIPVSTVTNVTKSYYSYVVGDDTYYGVCTTDTSLSPGTTLRILYNPDEPGSSVRKQK